MASRRPAFYDEALFIKGRFSEAGKHLVPTLRCHSSLHGYIAEALPEEPKLWLIFNNFLLETSRQTLAIKWTTTKGKCTHLVLCYLCPELFHGQNKECRIYWKPWDGVSGRRNAQRATPHYTLMWEQESWTQNGLSKSFKMCFAKEPAVLQTSICRHHLRHKEMENICLCV